jgi:hypothetical protein
MKGFPCRIRGGARTQDLDPKLIPEPARCRAAVRTAPGKVPHALPHLPDEGGGQRLAFLDLPAGKAPRPARIRVLVKQQDPPVLDNDSGHTHKHPANLRRRTTAGSG